MNAVIADWWPAAANANGMCFKQPLTLLSQPALFVLHNLHMKRLSMRVPSFDSAECFLSVPLTEHISQVWEVFTMKLLAGTRVCMYTWLGDKLHVESHEHQALVEGPHLLHECLFLSVIQKNCTRIKHMLTLWCAAACQWRRGRAAFCPALWAIWCTARFAWGGGTRPCPSYRGLAPPTAKDSAPRGPQRLNCSPRGTDLRKREKQKHCRTRNSTANKVLL